MGETGSPFSVEGKTTVAKLEPINQVVGFNLNGLDDNDWRVLDFAICALKDKVNKGQATLTEDQKLSMENLHTNTLMVLRGDWLIEDD